MRQLAATKTPALRGFSRTLVSAMYAIAIVFTALCTCALILMLECTCTAPWCTRSRRNRGCVYAEALHTRHAGRAGSVGRRHQPPDRDVHPHAYTGDVMSWCDIPCARLCVLGRAWAGAKAQHKTAVFLLSSCAVVTWVKHTTWGLHCRMADAFKHLGKDDSHMRAARRADSLEIRKREREFQAMKRRNVGETVLEEVRCAGRVCIEPPRARVLT
jgi:hypothetical protein